MHLGLESLLPLTEMLYISAILAFLLSIWKPEIGLYFLVPLLPLQTIRYRLHTYPLGALMVDFVLLGVGIGLKRKGRPIFSATPFNRIAGFFAIWTYIMLWRGSLTLNDALPFWIDNPRMQEWLNYMIIFLLLFLTFSAIRTRRQIMVLLVLMAFSVVVLDKGYYNNNKGRDFSHFSYEVRQSGAMGYAGENGFAAFEAQCVAFILGLYAMEKRAWLKAGYLGILGFCVYCVLFAFSRGAYAATVLSTLIVGLLKRPTLILVLVVVVVSAQTLLPKAVIERITTTTDESGGVESSAGERLTIWQDALELIRANAALGTGFNTYAYLGRVASYTDTHNLYLKVMVEMGIIGLVTFILLLRKMFIVGWSLYRSSDDPFLASLGLGFLAMMTAVAVANIFGDRWTYLQITGYTFTLMGLCLRAQEIVREEAAGDGAEAEEAPETGGRALTAVTP